jgi:hypothetical protein
MKTVLQGLVALALFVVGSTANGLTYIATNKTLSASATFTVTDLKLVITLSNTGTNDPSTSAQILTGIFFKLTGDPALAPTSALLGPDTTIKGRPGVTGPGTNVGGEWTYRNAFAGLPHGANEGVSIASLGPFRTRYGFPGPNLQGSVAHNGVQYGVTTDFDSTGNDKCSLAHQQLIENTVIFTLGGLPTNFTLASISDVSFQYGPCLTDRSLNLAGKISDGNTGPAIPEPSTSVLIGAGLLSAFALLRRPRGIASVRGYQGPS